VLAPFKDKYIEVSETYESYWNKKPGITPGNY
jgi:hypothetical protein